MQGQRVTLKPFTREAYRQRYDWQTDPDVSYYAHGQKYAVTAPVDAFMNGYERCLAEDPSRSGLFAVYGDGDELIGEVDYREMDLVTRSAVIGVTLGKKEIWGKGYGTDAVRTLCIFLFERFALERIQLDTWAENTRAIRSYEKVGFQIEGTLRKATLVNGVPSDVVIMGLLRDELKVRRNKSSYGRTD
ncbi:GNAT family N-acetyltransferase [Alicyclobacillus sp. ALC3]|uniref:GNAT family N-acetyltransferase n=1 Tax=Alicyclobacillus sp. ALC3 TaxID=2796143 RepID=UPI0023791D4C|nr:GNAT family protein [Alicyclobacillus sp. ALC3]